MPEKPVFSRFFHAQQGAAVIVALLVVALIAGIASAAVGNFGIALDGVQGRHDQAQARLLARASVDWARNVLAEDMRRTSVDHGGETWAIKVPVTPVEDGEVGGQIVDYSGRFNLNNLVRDGIADEPEIDRFVVLLETLGLSTGEARQKADALVDWLDRDDIPRSAESGEGAWYSAQVPQRTPPGAALVTVGEVAQVRGFDAELLSRLQPLVAALPAGSTINVNMASPEVLVALVPGMDLDAARRFVVERQRAWFKDMSDFGARLPPLKESPDFLRLSTTSRYFLIVVHARYGVSTVRLEALLDRAQTWSDIIWLNQS